VAVYTDVRDDELSALLKRYDIGVLHSMKGVAEGVENTNYLIATDSGQFFLTLYEKRVDPADLPFFVGLMEHLADRGINCPRPVRMRTGEMLAMLAGRPCAIVTFLDGVSIRRPQPAHCRQVGAALAAMHLAARDFALRRENALALKGWRPLFERSVARADEVDDGLGALIAAELDFLESHWPRDLPAGVIHADLFRDNVFFLKDRLSGLIDFYFACNDNFAYDVAICLNAWCFEADWSFNVTKARAMLEGYGAGRPLLPAEVDALPVLCRGSALRFLLTRLYDWLNVPPGALVVPHDPREYLAKLRFHQKVKSPAAYGLDFA
jgi:homoserine kinase type II